MKQKPLLAVLFSLTLLSNAAKANESEPNDSKAQANTFALNSSNNGKINPAGDQDWWKITTTGDGKLDITLTPVSGKYTWIFLYDNDGTTVVNSNNSNSTFTLSTEGVGAGTYYIKIICYYPGDTGSYNISNTLTQVSQANDVEPNDTKAQATILPVNSTKTGHVGYYYNLRRDSADWYKITTTSDGFLKLKIALTANKFVWIFLYDNDGTTVINSYNNATSFDLNTDGLAAGTYYVKIMCYYNYENAPYTLTDSLFAAQYANDAEPNDNKTQALSLGFNTTTTGHVGYYYKVHRDSADWYKITPNNDGYLKLTLTPGNGKYVWMYLYDGDGTTLINAYNNATKFDIKFDGLAPGSYYVKIACYYNYEAAPYTLTDSFFTYSYANDTEPNDFPYQAKTIPANGTVTGHVNFYRNINTRDSSDWWKINYTGSGSLTFNLNNNASLVDGINRYYQFVVYKDTAAAAIFSASYAGSSGNINLSALTQGYYWIKFLSYYNYEAISYSIATSFTQVGVATPTILQATNDSCTNGKLKIQITGSKPPYTAQLYRFGSPYGSSYQVNDSNAYFTSNLPPGTYYLTAFGDGANGSSYGTSNKKNLLPTATSNTSETNVSSTKATVHWTKITCANGYVVQYRKQGNTQWVQKILLGNKDSLNLTGLIPNTTYEWRVEVGVGLDSVSNYVLSAYTPIDVFTTTASIASVSGGTRETEVSSKKMNSIINVYPNPANTYVQVQIVCSSNQKVSAWLKDTEGRSMWNILDADAAALNNMRVDVSKLQAGVYFLVIGTADNIQTQKIIIQR